MVTQETEETGRVMSRDTPEQEVQGAAVVIMYTTEPLMVAEEEEQASTERDLMELGVREDQPHLHLVADQVVGSQQLRLHRSL